MSACTHCGKELPRDDAHFCNNCGTLVASHPFSSQSLVSSKNSSPLRQPCEKPVIREQVVQQHREKPVLREQLAHQSRPRVTRRIAQDDLTASPISWPTPMTHVSIKEASPQKEDVQSPQKDISAISPVQSQDVASERELHGEVLDQENLAPSSTAEKELPIEDGPVEELPTSSLAIPEQASERSKSPLADKTQESVREDLEQQDTLHLPNQGDQRPSASPIERSTEQVKDVTQRPEEQPKNAYDVYPSKPGSQQPVATPKLPSSQPSPRPVMHAEQASFTHSVQDRRAASLPAAMFTPSRRKSRTPFVVLLALLCIIVLGSGLWIAVAQPFTVPEVTKPLQDFKDTGLGVSLAYPTSWTVQHSSSAVLFSDSSQTAQVNLAAISSDGDVAGYLKQQTTKIGMTAAKSLASLSFAGASWQQMQGTVQRAGVNYTETMLATTHGSRLFLLTHAAPQTVYNDEESVVFAKLRSSLRFL